MMNQASKRRISVKNAGGRNGISKKSSEAKQVADGTGSSSPLGRNRNVGNVESRRKLWSPNADGVEKTPFGSTKFRCNSFNNDGVCRNSRIMVSRSLSERFWKEEVGSEEIVTKCEELKTEEDLESESQKPMDEDEEEEVTEEEEKQLVVVEVSLSKYRETKVVEDIKQNHIPPPTTSIERVNSHHQIPFDVGEDISCNGQEACEGIPSSHTRMHSIVDVVLWRDISRSAFVFGSGTFLLLSSSYAKDLNFSLISATSYVGLFYLALVFIRRSILRKERLDMDELDTKNSLREEDMLWLLRLVLPYLNEILFRVKCIFSGDPATTMKVAVLLFILARCGSSMTVWTLARFGFFGVFTLPKVYASYSVQLVRYGRFWMGRFRDAWDSCTHKKAAAIVVFTVIWNLSSVVARVWSVFILVVAVRLYQQSLKSEWKEDEEEEEEEEPPEVAAAAAASGQLMPSPTKESNSPSIKHVIVEENINITPGRR